MVVGAERHVLATGEDSYRAAAVAIAGYESVERREPI